MIRPIVMLGALAMIAAPTAGEAACPQRTTGTVVGAVAGGLLGHAIAGRGSHTEGTLLGAGAGGLIGNQVTKCRYARRAYYRAPPRRASAARPAAYARETSCRYETRNYYDAYGQMVYAPTRVCGG
jgi:uncharacterized protein YcfJ